MLRYEHKLLKMLILSLFKINFNIWAVTSHAHGVIYTSDHH